MEEFKNVDAHTKRNASVYYFFASKNRKDGRAFEIESNRYQG
jgi:hypothetical protein